MAFAARVETHERFDMGGVISGRRERTSMRDLYDIRPQGPILSANGPWARTLKQALGASSSLNLKQI